MFKKFIKELFFLILRIQCPMGLGHIGKHTIFRKPIRITGRKKIYIGNNCDIMNGARIECLQEWNYIVMEPSPQLIIGDMVNIGQNCHITCARRIEIGKGTSIMPDVLITDIKHIIENNKSTLETAIEVGSVHIGNYVKIGMGARIMANGKDLIIGDNAVIGANAVVTKNVSQGTVVVGVPARKLAKK